MRRFVTTVLALTLVLATGSPAAADDRVGLSRDGTLWADTISDPLFAPDTLWVPGDSRTVSFYVRNQADSDAVLTAAVRSADTDRLLADDHVRLRARVDGEWFALRNGTSSRPLTAASMSPGDAVRVDVEAGFSPTSSNASQARAVELMLEVRLAGAVEGTDPDPDEPTPDATPPDGTNDDVGDADQADGSDGTTDETLSDADQLPSTGSNTPAILIWMAVLAITAGAAFVAAGRREREHEDV